MCDFYLIDYIADHCLALLHLCFNKKYLSTFFVSSYSMSNVLTKVIKFVWDNKKRFVSNKSNISLFQSYVWVGGGWVYSDYSVNTGPFLRFPMLSLRCLTIQYVRTGT